MGQDHLSVKLTTQLTGLNEHTLRAWERRYGAVKPQRGQNGRRVYSRFDIERLRRISLLVERGFSIGRIAALSDQELADLLSEHMALDSAADDARLSEAHPDQGFASEGELVGETLTRIQGALARYDLAAIHVELQAARYLLGARTFALGLVSPLMGAVGRLTVSGRLSVCQEHALTAIVKAHLAGMILDMAPKSRADQIDPLSLVLATMEGNFHEVGIMISAVLCACRGVMTHYLGPNIPAAALGEAAIALRAKVVLLGATPVPPGTLAVSEAVYLKELDQKLAGGCAIWVGGFLGEEALNSKITCNFKLVKTLTEFDQILASRTSSARSSPS